MMFIIIVVLTLVIEMCGMMYTYATIANAAQEGARYGAIATSVVANDSRIISRVKSFAGISMHDVSAITVAVALPDGSATPPNRIRVTVSYTYVPWLSNIVGSSLVIHTYAEGTIVRQ